MKLTLLTAPTVEPITTDDAKTHARIFGSTEDDFVDGLIAAARQKWEQDTAYFLCEAEYSLTLSSLRHTEFDLPLRPVIEVESVNALVEDTDYTVKIDPMTGVATIKFLTSVPTDIVITFKIGYPNPADGDVHPAPAIIKHALKTLVAHWYNSREAFQEGSELKNVPATYQSIVTNYRLA